METNKESKLTNNNTVERAQKPPIYTKKQIALSRIKRKAFKHIHLVRMVIIILIIVFLLSSLWFFLGKVTDSRPGSNFAIIKNFILAPANAVESFEGRVNILILGKSGLGNDSPDLTDTIIFTSVNLTRPSVVLISLPRDIWVPSIRAKLNSAYYWGNQKEEGGGLILAKSLAEQVVGIPIKYAVVVDFSGFKEIIDILGGVEVDVERSFIDEKYPIAGRENDECEGDPEYKCRYETVRFLKGKQLMDGETALKFVRSRNAQGDEGTDTAREARQQKIITAVKDKILSPSTFLSAKKLISLWKMAKNLLETDIPGPSGVVIARKLFWGRNNLTTEVLPTEFLENPPISPRYDNQYVFIPAEGDWSKVKEWVRKKI